MTIKSFKNAAQKRDPGQFVAIPMAVMDSSAYLNLSNAAVRLLLDIARQYTGDNNGRLYCAWCVMKKRGWRSEATLSRAKQELLASQLISETRKGARPNKAAWYGVTWLACDDITGMDIKPSAFPRGAYWTLKVAPLTTISAVPKAA